MISDVLDLSTIEVLVHVLDFCEKQTSSECCSFVSELNTSVFKQSQVLW